MYVHTPIITSSDAEGAGEMFNVNSFDLTKVPLTEQGNVDYSKDFFSKPASSDDKFCICISFAFISKACLAPSVFTSFPITLIEELIVNLQISAKLGKLSISLVNLLI